MVSACRLLGGFRITFVDVPAQGSRAEEVVWSRVVFGCHVLECWDPLGEEDLQLVLLQHVNDSLRAWRVKRWTSSSLSHRGWCWLKSPVHMR